RYARPRRNASTARSHPAPWTPPAPRPPRGTTSGRTVRRGAGRGATRTRPRPRRPRARTAASSPAPARGAGLQLRPARVAAGLPAAVPGGIWAPVGERGGRPPRAAPLRGHHGGEARDVLGDPGHLPGDDVGAAGLLVGAPDRLGHVVHQRARLVADVVD